MKTFRKSFIKTKPLGKASSKAQSAMEYLMTYGWAILIIAVVLGALFELGVFNPMTFAPKAPPGACQVFRPNGPGTTSFINLEGICTGEIPEYVAQFNGYNSLIPVSLSPTIPLSSVTISGWFYVSGFTSGYGQPEWFTNAALFSMVGLQAYPNTYPSETGATSSSITYFLHNATGATYGCAIYGNPLNRWYFVTEVVSGTVGTLYVNGLFSCSFSFINPAGTETNLTIGGFSSSYNGAGDSMDGSLANIQIYNTSLSANDIQALYLEGVGGAPINLQHLVGWWPLNGNANDYSGNDNNGQASNVIYVSNWYSSYTPP